MIKNSLIKLIYRYVFVSMGLLFIKIISMTYRIRTVELEKKKNFINNSIIYASWHQRFFPAIVFFAKTRPIAAIISQSKDGELISRIATILGWTSVRGSSSKNGKIALKNIISLAQSGHNIGHAVDGPQGPFSVVKPGIIKIAQSTQARIVPVIISFDNYWMFNSWDHFMIPKPFAKVVILFSKSQKVPRFMNNKEFEKKRLFLENSMKLLYKRTDIIYNKNRYQIEN